MDRNTAITKQTVTTTTKAHMSIKNFFAPKRPREETAEDTADASPNKKMKTASYVILIFYYVNIISCANKSFRFTDLS